MRALDRRRGASAVEYAILLMLIGVVAFVAVRGLGVRVADLAGEAANEIGGVGLVVTDPVPDGGGATGPGTGSVQALLPPDAGYYQPGDKLSFVVRFSDPVSVTRSAGIPHLDLDIGGASRVAEDDGTGSGDIRRFTYTIASADPMPASVTVGGVIDPDGDTITRTADGGDVDLALPGSDTDLLVDEAPDGPVNIIEANNSKFTEIDGLADGGWYALNPVSQVYRFAADGSLSWARQVRMDGVFTSYDRMTALSDGGVAVAGSSAGKHYIARVDADGNHVWTKRITSPEVSGWGIMAVVETGLGHIVAVGSESGTHDGFLIRLDADGDLVSKSRFYNTTVGNFGFAVFVRDAAASVGRFAITGELGSVPTGQFTMVLPDAYAGIGEHSALYQHPAGDFSRHQVEPTAIAADAAGLGFYTLSRLTIYGDPARTMVQRIQPNGDLGDRGIHDGLIPDLDIVSKGGRIFTVGDTRACPECEAGDDKQWDRAAGVAEINGAGLIRSRARYLDAPGGDGHEALHAIDAVGGSFALGGQTHDVVPNTNINMLTGLIDELDDFTCTDDCGVLSVPGVWTPPPSLESSIANMDQVITMQLVPWDAAKITDVSAVSGTRDTYPRAEDMYDPYPF